KSRPATPQRKEERRKVDILIQNLLNALQWGSFYALIALGYTLVYALLGFLDFAPWMVLALTVPLTMILTAGTKGAHRLYVVITALMCGLILENGNLALLGASRKKFPELLDKVVYTFGNVSVTNLKIIVIFAAIAVFLLLQFIVTKTKIGMAMRGISYDKFAIPLMGIPI
ncbi:branched-chain amino acid ABC transporter permease, partial [Aduncisulcus paluster]